MAERIKLFGKGLMALVVAAALAFGASQAFASTSMTDCDQVSGFIGYCPPFDDSSCFDTCLTLYGTPGECVRSHCCICAI